MTIEIERAAARGHANHGWLDTAHSFSFASYYNPQRMGFGALRVLNDDVVAPSRGFGTHPHDNMEIISIPLRGDLEHQDSMGNVQIISEGDIQVMSAGTGIFHSEKNRNTHRDTNFLQIWVIPNRNGVEPRYDQISIADLARKNQLFQVLSPNADDQGVWIYQDAWFSMGKYDLETSETYRVHRPESGISLFVIEGEIVVDNHRLNRRDGMSITECEEINFTALPGTELLLMEVPVREENL